MSDEARPAEQLPDENSAPAPPEPQSEAAPRNEQQPEEKPTTEQSLAEQSLADQAVTDQAVTDQAGGEEPSNDQASAEQASDDQASKRRILIGSQRDPAAYRARPRRDWKPVTGGEPSEAGSESARAPHPPTAEATTAEPPPATPPGEVPSAEGSAAKPEASPADAPAPSDEPRGPSQRERNRTRREKRDRKGKPKREPRLAPVDDSPKRRNPPPSLRHELPPELEAELQEAMGEGESLEAMLGGGESAEPQVELAPETQHAGRVVTIRHEDVFVELGSREQGVVSMKQFDEPPQPGDELQVIVQGFNRDDGLYELSLPNRAVDVEDWSQIREGMTVQAQITGHNTGGLECEVNHIRGFIPVSQVSLYRVEDMEQFVGESWPCLVTEANEDRRNLVLSRKAILEREREEAKQKFLEELQPGDVHEGTVRKILDFGAFVELGQGIDGLLHVSQLSWARVNHPSEVLKEGETVKVQVVKVDDQTGKIGLSCRDLLPNPWEDVQRNYPEGAVVRGRVSKLMEFGAFVELEPGVEGLVHVSELSHKRVWRPSDVVSEGDELEVLVLSVDPDAQRIGLSIKQLSQPEPSADDRKQAAEDAASAEPADAGKKKRQPQPAGPLKGGLGRGAGGEQFGLKW